MPPKKKTKKTIRKTIEDAADDTDPGVKLEVVPEPVSEPSRPSEMHGVGIEAVDGLNSYDVSRLALGVKEVFRTQNHKGRITLTLDAEKLR